MTNDKDSLIQAMRDNIEGKQKFIDCLLEKLYQLEGIIERQESLVIKKYTFPKLEDN